MTSDQCRKAFWKSLLFGLGAAVSLVAAPGCSSSTDQGTTQPTPEPLPEPVIPQAQGTCPVLQTTNGIVHQFGVDLLMWVGEKLTDQKGPVLFYWHGTGSVAQEITVFMQPMLDEIQAQGGVAVSFETSVCSAPSPTCITTGNNVWYKSDYEVADAILACAVQQLNIDTRRIYAAGCSAGGLQSGTMVLDRSSYLAAAMPNSGGEALNEPFEDLTHIPSVITAHGTTANELLQLPFADWSLKLDQEVANNGGYSADCVQPNGHCMIFSPQTVPSADLIAQVSGAQWQFLKDHPFGVKKDPYADGLPPSFPSFCAPVSAGADQ